MPQKVKPASRGNLFLSRLRRDLEVLVNWHRDKRRWDAPLQEVASLKNSHDGQKLLIIANGPSAESLPENFSLDFRRSGGKVMAMNWAHLNPAASAGPIDYYICADRRMIENNEKSGQLRAFLAKQNDLVGFVPEFRLEKWRDAIAGVRFVPFCHYYVRFLRAPSWGISPHKPKAFTSQTGLHSLQIATWMGFEPIFIIGFDNSQFQNLKLDRDNSIRLIQTHAGEEPESSNVKISDTATFLERQADLFRDYWLFSDSRVFNLDSASLTDAFHKASHELALEPREEKATS